MQFPLRILAFGDSLTAGYFNYGSNYNPYSNNLFNLFSASNIPVAINQQGISGEHVVPSMVQRLEQLLQTCDYNWVLILGGTNDLGYNKTAETIFNEGLKIMYEMVLHYSNKKCKLAVMTVIENGYNQVGDSHYLQRRHLNEMIRHYVINNLQDQNRICLVDLEHLIPYHSITDIEQRNRMWNDLVHLTPEGYDYMAYCIFQEIYKNLSR